MNTLKTILSSFFLLFTFALSAQKKDAATDLPYTNKIEINTQALEILFQSADTVSLELAPGFHLTGAVQDKSAHGATVTSLLIRVDSKPGGTFSISRYQDERGNLYYSGYLLKLHQPDGMMLVEKDRHYYLIETQQRYLVAE